MVSRLLIPCNVSRFSWLHRIYVADWCCSNGVHVNNDASLSPSPEASCSPSI